MNKIIRCVNTTLVLNLAWLVGVILVAFSSFGVIPQWVGLIGAVVTLAALFVGWRQRKLKGDAAEDGSAD